MSRMLDALKVLETRQRAKQQTNEPAPRAAESAWMPADEGPDLAAAVELAEDLEGESLDALEQAAEVEASEAAQELPAVAARPAKSEPAFEVCTLPIASEVGEHYREMADTISRQLASNYCNVLLFVGADRWAQPSFSMIHLAQAFAESGGGDVLLVDGDLRFGRLSKSVAPPGPGMSEAMLGQAAWTDMTHPTQTARIDFVTAGNAQVPTVERSEFGWGALRPLYRFVLIGLANQSEPETTWLGGRSDAVYLVLSRPHTRRSSASAAVNGLRACGANVMGSIVVND